MGKYGTNLTGIGAYEGGLNNDKGSPLVANNTDGETALLFGPAALREIQAGVANGDFAIPPDQASATITAENPLPYWTWTPAALITAAIITDATAGSTNVFQVSCGAASNLQTAYLTRFIAVASSGDRGKTYVPVFRFGAATGASAAINVRCRYFQQDQTTAVGTEFSASTASGTQTIIPTDLQFATVPSDAAYLKITIEFQGTVLANTSILQEVRVISGDSYIFLSEATPSSDGPGQITIDSSPKKFRFNKGLVVERASVFDSSVEVASLTSTGAITATGDITASGFTKSSGSTLSQYNNISSADNTTITTAGTYLALTNLEVSFTPQFVGQRWLFTFTGYASLNTAVAQYAFVRADVTTSANVAITSPWAYSRSENPGTSGRGGAVAISKVWVADRTTGCKFKLYGTTQTTNGLILSVAYSALTAYPIG